MGNAKSQCEQVDEYVRSDPDMWLLALCHVCMIMCNRKYRLEDSDQMLTGQVPDISPLLKYKFNEPVYYKETQTRFGPRKRLGTG
jgi:hypothetical protein